MLKTISKAGAAGLLFVTMAIAPASAHTYHRHYYPERHSYDSHHHYHQCKTGGTVLGVVGGALIGNAVTHHSTAGTVIGAGVGGVAGNHIARSNCSRR